ncbi:MAG: histidine kinase, partial [Clostridia bacterium]
QYPYFEEMIYTAISPPPDELYVLSDIGLVLYSTRREMINRPFFYYPQISRRYEQVHASEDHTLITRQSVHFETVSQDDHISLYSVLDANDFTLPYSRTMIFLTSMIVIVLSLAVSFLMSIKMYRNIVEMILLIQNPEECPRSTAGLGEFLYISESISSATKKSNAMRAKLQTSLDALKSSQSVALQAQINPHFLFNTLQMVNLAILKECKADNDAVRIVNLLSDLLRCAFDNSTVLVSVEEEMDYAEKYLQIQKIRYRDRLQIHIFVEEETYPYKTLKLMCQPLIENCILHGLLRQKGEWHIHLHAFIEGSMLCVEIRDNGVGMSEAALASLRTRIEQSTLNKAENIGLANVHARLRLIFAEHYSLSLESKEGVGTTICLRHPLL